MSGRQFREMGKMVYPNVTQNAYFPHIFNDKAEQIIHNSDSTVPWFMWFATPLVHTCTGIITGLAVRECTVQLCLSILAIDLYTDAMHTMPQYQLRPAVSAFTNQFPVRKQLLGRDLNYVACT